MNEGVMYQKPHPLSRLFLVLPAIYYSFEATKFSAVPSNEGAIYQKVFPVSRLFSQHATFFYFLAITLTNRFFPTLKT